jgi:adenosylcobyric acid synthase
MTKTSAIMFQGTGSDVGKSLLVAGLCRAYHRRGLVVRPFKPQNMSNNAAVTVDGGEIGRAQALQARAACTPTSIHMNPVLLKPQSDTGSQVIVQGAVETTAKARDYHALKASLMPRVLDSYKITSENADLVIVEGAGSAAEVNLRDSDIANMGFALAANVPVALIGDIDRGGVIASFVGTHVLISQAERDLVCGFVVNKFRGDPTLFDDAITLIEERTGFSSLGIVPYFADARFLPKEDAMALDNREEMDTPGGKIKIAVPRIPRIANFDDLDPFMAELGVQVDIVEAGHPIPGDAHAVLIPGSKATLADFSFLCEQGWDIDIVAHHRRGGMVVGLCGGYQMLGNTIADPDGIEGPPESRNGLGLLQVDTVLGGEKTLVETEGRERLSNTPVRGYEIHMGDTAGSDSERPWFHVRGDQPEGACSTDGLVMGSYLHGMFAEDEFRRAFLSRLAAGHHSNLAFEDRIERTLDGLAAHLENHMDLDKLLKAAD